MDGWSEPSANEETDGFPTSLRSHKTYRQISNTSRTLVDNEIVDNSDVVRR